MEKFVLKIESLGYYEKMADGKNWALFTPDIDKAHKFVTKTGAREFAQKELKAFEWSVEPITVKS